MEGIDNFLAKLDKIKFVDTDKHDRYIDAKNEFKLYTELKLDPEMAGGVQIVLRLIYKDGVCAFWGCINGAENQKASKWLILKKEQMFADKYKAKNKYEKQGKAIFDKL